MAVSFHSLVDVLCHRAAAQAESRAYAFLADHGRETDVLTFAELDRRARLLAAHLILRAEPGERALLLFPPGLDFIVGFLGCLYAGVIAVPMMPPRRHRLRESSLDIIKDCAPKFCLTVAEYIDRGQSVLNEMATDNAIEWIAVDEITTSDSHARLRDRRAHLRDRRPEPDRQTIAFLQYTSGSTSAPKGVMVSHGNLLANLEMIRLVYGTTRRSTFVSWVPLYHDMGLILNVLQTLYVGALCVLMAPVTFMQRPLSWLTAIHSYRAEVAGAPNFAFDTCVSRLRPEQLDGLDLSCWKLAFNGAEPVRADTLERFAEAFSAYGFQGEALYPCYGMAEATLLISGGKRGAGPALWPVSREALKKHRVLPPAPNESQQRLVGCGKVLVGEKIAIVDPDNHVRLGPCEIGEIWVHGPNVALGYWHKADVTEQTFRARIAGEADAFWLRTGDLGCLDENGELYIAGRIKDVIIIRGANYYPQDIERTAERSHPALRPNCSAAFTVSRDDQDQLVLVHEIERTQRHRYDAGEIIGSIRMAVVQEHELTIHDVVIIETGTISKTTSGKIRRSLTRQLWLNGELEGWGNCNRSQPLKGGSLDRPIGHQHSFSRSDTGLFDG
jgi:acyl-CoA synthetase (AMP-forming)/AMP-acid ligase II